MRTVAPLEVNPDDVPTLLGWLEHGAARRALQLRARIVLMARDGCGPTRISDTLGCSKQTAISWRNRYRTHGLAGLVDAPRSGRPLAIDPELVLAATRQPPPEHLGARYWTSRLLAGELGVSNVTVAKIWRAHGLNPRWPAPDHSLSLTQPRGLDHGAGRQVPDDLRAPLPPPVTGLSRVSGDRRVGPT